MPVNIDDLRELDELFERRYEALILLCLAHGVAEAGRPLHFRQWARLLIAQTGTYTSDNAITRSLPRLKENGLVLAYNEDTRHPSYQPTQRGEQKAALLTFLLDAIATRRSQNGEAADELGDDGQEAKVTS